MQLETNVMLHSGKQHHMRRSFSFIHIILLFWISIYPTGFARAADTEPPDITNVEVTEVSDTSVKVKWATDEFADSLVNYGLQKDYGIVRIPVTDRKEHEIVLDGLDSGRIYYFRVVSSDEEGNQGISADYKVQTTGTFEQGTSENTTTEVNQTIQSQQESQTESTTEATTQSQTTAEIIEQVQQITSPVTLTEILNETVKAIQGITEDLTIVGPPTVIPETITAVVKWTTDRAASSKVLFSSARDYVDGQYSFSQESTGAPAKDHEITLIGLEPYTEYHFKVESTDSYGITGLSRDYTFKTKAALPSIRNLRI